MTNKINGIDVSECPLYDKNTSCYHTFNGECVQDSCAVYKGLLEFKRLQEENKSLQMLSCANCGEKYLSPDGAELYEKNVQLQEENEELKYEIDRHKDTIYYLNNHDLCLKTLIGYKQALEKIKKWATNHNPCYIEADINCTKEDCFECLNYDIKKITEIINEVFNDN